MAESNAAKSATIEHGGRLAAGSGVSFLGAAPDILVGAEICEQDAMVNVTGWVSVQVQVQGHEVQSIQCLGTKRAQTCGPPVPSRCNKNKDRADVGHPSCGK